MNSPSEIAREALRQLSTQRIPPTPDNYRTLYLKIAGGGKAPAADPAAFNPQQQLKEVLDHLPRRTEDERAAAADAEAALERQQWPRLTRILAKAVAARSKDAVPETRRPESKDPLADSLREISATIMESMVVPLLADAPALTEEARGLARKLRTLTTFASADELTGSLRRLMLRIEFHLEDQTEIRAGLLHLLQLVIDNIGELVIDENWLVGQMSILRGILAAPLNTRSIDNAERRLKEVLFKQGQLKVGLSEAQNSLKTMLASFVDQLASFAQSTGAYHDKIDVCAQKIDAASNISQLSSVIEEIKRETRNIQLSAKNTRGELEAARMKVAEAERKVAELEGELSLASTLVRYDQLTGALNRRGLEEVFEQEINRARRRDSPLSLAVLDVDDFKKLNDSFGHQAGDDALIHLVSTIKQMLRPQDTVARYGGEEFVVVLPDTPLEEARQVLVRVQRELTRHYFLHDNQKILITFSAGVTELPKDETREHAIKRADELMYQAKTTGKNKVVAA